MASPTNRSRLKAGMTALITPVPPPRFQREREVPNDVVPGELIGKRSGGCGSPLWRDGQIRAGRRGKRRGIAGRDEAAGVLHACQRLAEERQIAGDDPAAR